MVDDGNSFLIHLDKSLLMTEGKELIKKLLLVLQTYKSSGATERARKFYSEYSAVSETFLKIREIVLRGSKPGRLWLYNNVMRYSESVLEPLLYPATPEGLILSNVERHRFSKDLYEQVKGVWDQYKDLVKL